MRRNIVVKVDADSWGTRAVPATFQSGLEICDIGEVLLTIGLITSPPRASGFSLSEYWAWIRYACAISEEENLSLVSEYKDLDPHQKTILSDDFGMGFSVYWMWKRMDFSFICDGRYFVDRYFNHFGGGAAARTPGRRGPTKCPDFVCWKPAGLFHVVECKGTQSGKTTSAKQIATAQGQKTTINFPNARQGERIACGMKIEFEGSRRGSELFVTDPDYKPVLDVTENNLYFAEETTVRGLVSRVLAISGLPSTALAFAEPDIGAVASSRPKTSQKKKEEFDQIDVKRQRLAEDELVSRRGRALFQEGGQRYTGQERVFDLPVPVVVSGRLSDRVMVRQGINVDAIEGLSLGNFKSRLADFPYSFMDSARRIEANTEDELSFIKIGDLYRAELSFL